MPIGNFPFPSNEALEYFAGYKPPGVTIITFNDYLESEFPGVYKFPYEEPAAHHTHQPITRKNKTNCKSENTFENAIFLVSIGKVTQHRVDSLKVTTEMKGGEKVYRLSFKSKCLLAGREHLRNLQRGFVDEIRTTLFCHDAECKLKNNKAA